MVTRRPYSRPCPRRISGNAVKELEVERIVGTTGLFEKKKKKIEPIPRPPASIRSAWLLFIQCHLAMAFRFEPQMCS